MGTGELEPSLEGNWKEIDRKLSNASIPEPHESDMEKREMARRMRALKKTREDIWSQVTLTTYLSKFVNTLGYSPPTPGFSFYKIQDQLRYTKKYFVDLRWGKYAWQSYLARNCEFCPVTKKRYKYSVKQVPRRHGKTYYDNHDGRDYLLSVKQPLPVGAYYCPVKDQAIRNAWQIWGRVLAPLPGHYINKSHSYMTFPLPTLSNPDNFVTIYFFGVVGGTASKRGGYYDWVYFDEVEYIDQGFIEEAGFVSIFDRDGIARLTGTPAGHGQIGYWLSEAHKRKLMREGQGKVKMSADAYQWFSYKADCYTLKVYPQKRLEEIEAAIGKVTFDQEFRCIDSLEAQGFYHKAAVEALERTGGVNPHIKVDANLPLRAYFDLGLGTKSDRMAFIICQLGPGYIKIFWAQNVFEKGYAAAVRAVRECPYAKSGIFEIVLPHDAKTSEQSDAIPKFDKFEMEVKKQGLIGTSVRTMDKSSDKLMDTYTVTELIPFMQIHELDAMELVEALKGHKKKFLKKEKIFVQEPSKTKYRDLADSTRLMCVDYKYDTFTKAVKAAYGFVDPTLMNTPKERDPDHMADVGFHPSRNSIIVRSESGVEYQAAQGTSWLG